MGERSSYRHGEFCYVDLMTRDHDAAVTFYADLLSLEVKPEDTGGHGKYTSLMKDGRTVAAVGEDPREGHPPAWCTYIAVDDVEAAARKASDLGAMLLVEPMDVGGHGRMATVQDPDGAVFHLWQASGAIGAELVNEMGAYLWAELAVENFEAVRPFYEQMFDWRFEKMSMSSQPEGESGDAPSDAPPAGGEEPPYWVIYAHDRMTGGLMETGGQMPTAWGVYFAVPDVDAALKTVTAAGGQVVVPAMDISVGRMAVVSDPQGACFSMMTPSGPMDP